MIILGSLLTMYATNRLPTTVTVSPKIVVHTADYGRDNMSPALLEIHLGDSKTMRFGNTEAELNLADWEQVRKYRWWWLPTGVMKTTLFAEFKNANDKVSRRHVQVSLHRDTVSAPCLNVFQIDGPCSPGPNLDDQLMNNQAVISPVSFENGTNHWWTYYFSNHLPYNIFYPVTWHNQGGVNNGAYISTDDSRWAIDTPETPNSILAFLTYQQWSGNTSANLSNKSISFYLRGDKLMTKGAQIYFWIVNNKTHARWHYTAYALQAAEGNWSEKITFILVNDPASWHNSWSPIKPGENPGTLNEALANVDSYGISFIGFPAGDKPTGQLSIDEFSIDSTE